MDTCFEKRSLSTSIEHLDSAMIGANIPFLFFFFFFCYIHIGFRWFELSNLSAMERALTKAGTQSPVPKLRDFLVPFSVISLSF